MKRCPYCRALFHPPARQRGSPVRFCSPAHRKLYHKLGALPFSKFQDRIAREIGKRFGEFCSKADHLDLNLRTVEAFERTQDLLEKHTESFEQLASERDRILFEMEELMERIRKLERDSGRSWAFGVDHGRGDLKI